MPYELMLEVLDHIEVHPNFLNIKFLAGINIRVDLPATSKPQPRWTHVRKAKSPMAQRRMELGLTQEQLAGKVGMARTYLINIENGRSVPSPEMMKRLSDILGFINLGL